MIKKIANTLNSLGIALTSEELADSLWLAAKMATFCAKTYSPNLPSSDLPNTENKVPPPKENNDSGDNEQPPEEKKPLSPDPVSNQNIENKKEKNISTTGITPVKMPIVRALNDPLSISRQLRQLKKKTLSKRCFEIDEDLTAKQIAEQRIWSPIMRPKSSHPFDMVLVIDDSDSMFIWKKHVREFELLLKGLGAFRNLEKWTLISNINIPKLYKNLQQHNYKELSSSSDIPRLIFILTDCVSISWYNGEIFKIISNWSKNNIVVILQLLPETLWIRTALGKQPQVILSTPFPRATNSQLKQTSTSLSVNKKEDYTLVPVIQIEANSIHSWVNLVKALSNNHTIGVALPKKHISKFSIETNYNYLNENINDILDGFWATASPKAQKLAILMSAIPFDLNLIYLIQKKLLNSCDNSLLAEVFLSGLVRKNKHKKNGKEQTYYDFTSQVRNLLHDSLSLPDLDLMSKEISYYTKQHFGQPLDVLTFVKDPDALNTIEINNEIKPFVSINIQLLKRLGNRYKQTISILEKRLVASEIDSDSNISNSEQKRSNVLSLIQQVAKTRTLSLDLSSQSLTELPDELYALTELETLILNNNNLFTLPTNLFSLKKLKSLDLSINQISFIPSEIYNLSFLEALNISDNKLIHIPLGIKNLTNLQYLNLSNNQLQEIPEGISSLTKLKYLELFNNQITAIPLEFSKLLNLKILRLTANPLPIPPQILDLEDTPQKVLSYYFELLSNQEKKQLNEAKMLVVGEGAVGKTSLVCRLANNIFKDTSPMTYGTNINKWPIHINNQRKIQLNIWEFGGQEIMHATHQFFLTKRSLYLLVLDSSQDEQQNRLDYWLKTIEIFADDAPIIIVINKIDVQSLELDRRGLRLKYPTIKAFIETSCKDGLGIDALKQAITKQLSELKHIDDLLVPSWFKVKNQLENLQKKHKDYLDYFEYQEMCRKQNIDTLSEETLIDFLHDIGIILYFHYDPRVNSTCILNPNWVTEGVYKILNYNGLAIDKGELKISSLSDILNDIRYPKNKHKFIIEMMRKFELCFELEGSNGNKLLIPDLLPKQAPELGNWDDSLKFEYHYDLLPTSVISRFIVRMNTFIYDKTYWRYGVVLESEDNQNKALVNADLDAKKIFIFVTGRADTRKDFLSIVRADLLKIHKTIPKLQANEKIPLPKHPSIVANYKHLLVLKENNQTHFIPEGYNKLVSVSELLEGIERKPIVRISDDLEKISHTISDMKESILTEINGNVTENIINQVVTKLSNPQPTQQPKPLTQKPEPVTKAEHNSEQLKEKAPMTKPIHVLHLSDIHLGTIQDAEIYYSKLKLDLIKNLELQQLQYLVISGDIANKSTKEEYEAAFKLINDIKLSFSLKNEQIIVVPGNHDLNWTLSAEAYGYVPQHALPTNLTDDYIPIPGGALQRDRDKHKKRFDNFASFYKKICGSTYPIDYEDQAILYTFPQDRLLFLALNSSWNIDDRSTNNSNINQQALANAIDKITNTNYKDWLKVAVWHHPVTGQETMKNTGFLEQLAVAGFEVCLHGHIHEAISNFYSYDSNRGLHIIGGGTFGAPAKEQTTSIPLQYNLLVLEPSKASITVKTRKKEKVDGAWSADARWGDKEEPKAFYTIELKRSFQENKQKLDF